MKVQLDKEISYLSNLWLQQTIFITKHYDAFTELLTHVWQSNISLKLWFKRLDFDSGLLPCCMSNATSTSLVSSYEAASPTIYTTNSPVLLCLLDSTADAQTLTGSDNAADLLCYISVYEDWQLATIGSAPARTVQPPPSPPLPAPHTHSENKSLCTCKQINTETYHLIHLGAPLPPRQHIN